MSSRVSGTLLNILTDFNSAVVWMFTILLISCCFKWSPHGVVVNELGCDILASEFELHSLYYVHFRTNAPWGKA